MAIKRNPGTGYVDIASIKRYEATAWKEATYARKYVSGAWQDVWTNAKPFYIIQDFNLVNPTKMGGWVRNNFYAYANNVSSNGGRLGYTAQAANNGNVVFATAAANSAPNIGPGDVTPIAFPLDKCNKCRIVIDSIGGTNNGGIDIRIGGISVPHNNQAGTYIIDLGAATTSYIWVQIVAWATNTNYVYIKELYFYKG